MDFSWLEHSPACTLLLTDTVAVDGSVFLHTLLSSGACLKRPEHSAAIMSFERTLTTFARLARKIEALDLSAAQAQGRLLFIEGLNISRDQMLDGNAELGPADGLSKRLDGKRSLVEQVEEHLEEWAKKRHLSSSAVDCQSTVILDGLSTFNCLQGFHRTMELVRKVEELAGKHGFRIVNFLHRDGDAPFPTSEPVSAPLSVWLAHRAEVVLSIVPLALGTTREVHGRLVLSRGGRASASNLFRPMEGKDLLYQALDSRIECLVKGSIT